MIHAGEYVINKNDLKVRKHQLTGNKYVATTDIYKVIDVDCDGFEQIQMIDINTGKTCYYSNKDCLVKVWG